MVKRLDERATWLVGRAQVRAHALLQEVFAAAGARPYHYRILAALAELGTASQADIGRLTGIDRSDVTAALDVLCGAGFATRSPDPADGRRKLVSLTEQGRAQLDALDTVLDDVQAEFLGPLTPSEQRTFLDLIGRLASGR